VVERQRRGPVGAVESGRRKALFGFEEFVVPVANSHFGDVGHLADGGLGGLLVGE